jgi:hypothetical protein
MKCGQSTLCLVSEIACWLPVLQVVAAFVYYGLVQLVPQLEFVAGESKQCLQGHLTVPVSHSSTSAAAGCQVASLVKCTCISQQQAARRHFARDLCTTANRALSSVRNSHVRMANTVCEAAS